jgi:hypothetical protein
VLARATSATHLMHDGRLQTHVPNEVARVRDDGLLVYDVRSTDQDASPEHG